MKNWSVVTACDIVEIPADRIAFSPEAGIILFFQASLKDGELTEILVGTAPSTSIVSQKGE